MPSETNPKGVVEVLDAVRYGAGVAGAVLVFLLGQMVLRRRAAKAA
jgi:hypothetical protein